MKADPVLRFMKAQCGYARTMELLRQGFSYRRIQQLVASEKIESITRGLYRLTSVEATPTRDLVDVCRAIPKAVVCLYSALSYYELTTFVPTDIMIAIPQGYHVPTLAYPPLQVFHFSSAQYQEGIETVQAKIGAYRIYSPEKSVCDAFRFRKKLGDDTAKEALFAYLEKRRGDLKTLLGMAAVCRMSNVMKPYIEARIG